MEYTEYIIMPIVILIFYNIFTKGKISLVNNIVAFVLLGGGFFVVDTFDGYLYYIAIIILATVVVSIDYLLSKKEKTWRDELRSEEHTSELQSRFDLVCRLLLEKKKNMQYMNNKADSKIK